MAINFPDSPTNGDTHTVGDKTWTYDGTSWNLVQSNVADHGNLGGLGDDDHTQYLLADGSRTATELTVSGDLTVGTDKLRVDSTNGLVGIGTASPSFPFHVKNDSTYTAVIQSTNSRAFVSLRGTGESAFDQVGIGTDGSNGLELHAGDNPRLVIDSSGNVGIGTTSPSYTLDVDGDINMRTGHSFYYDVAGATNPNPIFWIDGENTDVDIIRVGTENFSTDSDYGMTLKYQGSGAGNSNTFDVEMDAQAGAQVVAMRVYQDGTVTTPTVPAFRARAYYTDASSALSGQTTATFYDVNLNNGNDFLTSGTGAYQRFVAPVSGYYAFHLSWVVYQATSGYYYGFQFRKNNVEIEPHHYFKQQSAGNDDGNSMSVVEYCAANDYVTCVTNFQDSRKLQISVFTGHLIG